MTSIEVKTADLIGPALDWAVAMAEGAKPERPHDGQVSFGSVHLLCGSDQERGFHAPFYSPSTDWSQGGPLIARERIGLWPTSNGYFAEKRHFGRHHKAGRSYGEGPTSLIAAMRCLVAAKLGDTVQVPEELLP
jgi:hypothetical protein